MNPEKAMEELPPEDEPGGSLQSSYPGMNLKAAMLELTPGDEAGTTVEELPPKDEPGGIHGGASNQG